MSNEGNTNFNVVNYTTHSVDLTKLPPVSVHRLASYGFAHLLGNQAASKVVAWQEKDENKNATDEQKAAAKTDFQAKMIAALLDGTIGSHASRGPAVDPQEAEMESLARVEVLATLKANNIKVPKKGEAVEFASGEKLTLDELVERRLAKHGERLGTEATASLKAKAKAKEAKAKKLAGVVAGAGAADLL